MWRWGLGQARRGEWESELRTARRVFRSHLLGHPGGNARRRGLSSNVRPNQVSTDQ
jgi:hypothetical protein